MEGAAARWAESPPLDDESLTTRIGHEFGIKGGFCFPTVWVDYHGGAHPCIDIKVVGEPDLELDGRALLVAVRDVLGLVRPGELF
jgi:hypothetical protein